MKKSSLMCAPLIALVVAVGLGANSQALAQDAKEILSQNPNLKSVTEIPVNLEVGHVDRCRHFRELAMFGDMKAVLAGVTINHVCIHGQADMGFKSYEKDYGKKRYFVFVLHPETPRVWRVYETDKYSGRYRISWARLLAEFDQTGKRLARPASLPDTNAAGGGTVQTGTGISDGGTKAADDDKSLAVAAQYQCQSVDKDTRQIVTIAIEAHSKEEATYKAGEHAAAAGEAAKRLGKAGVNCRSAEELVDVFLSDLWFKNNSQLRPYLPPDVKLSNTRAFECDPSGGFLPDNHPDSMKGYFCSEIVSSAYNATWKVRYKSGGIGQVWKRVGNEWSPWVNLPWISPDAEKFAATRTPKVQVTVGAGTPTPTMPGTTEEPPASSPPQAGNPVVDAAKKAVDDLLKRLGK